MHFDLNEHAQMLRTDLILQEGKLFDKKSLESYFLPKSITLLNIVFNRIKSSDWANLLSACILHAMPTEQYLPLR